MRSRTVSGSEKLEWELSRAHVARDPSRRYRRPGSHLLHTCSCGQAPDRASRARPLRDGQATHCTQWARIKALLLDLSHGPRPLRCLSITQLRMTDGASIVCSITSGGRLRTTHGRRGALARLLDRKPLHLEGCSTENSYAAIGDRLPLHAYSLEARHLDDMLQPPGLDVLG